MASTKQTKAQLLARIAELEAAELARTRVHGLVSIGTGRLVKDPEHRPGIGTIDMSDTSCGLGAWIEAHNNGDPLEVFIRG